ncbi:MAG: glycosyltransferase family 2 protein [Bacteroidota bacterium]
MQENSDKPELPLVSVVIPVYNGEKFISQTISAVLQQTYKNMEIIVVNDGSTDKTKTILEQISSPQLKVVHKSNSGVSDTRNAGISLAKGKYIALLDADDRWHPDNLEKKITLLESDNTTGFVFSDMNNADENLRVTGPAPKGKDDHLLENLLSWNGEVIPGPCSNVVARKICFDEGIKFDSRLTTIADQHFTVQLASRYKGKRIPEVLWDYRIVAGSMSKSLAVMEKDMLNVYAIYRENKYFRSENFRRKCFANMYLILAASFWKDGNNKKKGFYYIRKAIASAPFHSLFKLVKKIFKGN